MYSLMKRSALRRKVITFPLNAQEKMKFSAKKISRTDF